jgi:hypothetical protein
MVKLCQDIPLWLDWREAAGSGSLVIEEISTSMSRLSAEVLLHSTRRVARPSATRVPLAATGWIGRSLADRTRSKI